MKSQTLTFVILGAVLLATMGSALAFETDQFALPPVPLEDIGDEVSRHIDEGIAIAVANVNAGIDVHEACLRKTAPKEVKCGAAETEAKKLADLRTAGAIARSVYEQLGEGSIFTGATAKWFRKHKFAREPSRFKPDFSDSIFVTMPINYVTISPTVRMYGSEFGFDKIDHFFQQGYKYYKIYNDAVGDGKTAEEAARKAIKWGQRTERTYFGTLVSGVYSNGDLFANYAGMKFYQRLTANITVAGKRLGALLEIRDGRWERNESPDGTLEPFVGDQMNEALNPSGFSFFIYPIVKKVVRDKDCPAWRQLYPLQTADRVESRSRSLETWAGEDYGFTTKSKTVRISSCFENG